MSNKFLLIPAFLIVVGIVFVGYSFSQPPQTRQILGVNQQAINGQQAVVTDVIDGDTIEVEIEGQKYKVRYIGVDTPETVDPRRPDGCFGKQASEENKRLVKGKTVYLVRDISESDSFGRLLRYVYVEVEGQMTMVNDYLVRNGFAKVSTFPPDVKYTDQFLQAQSAAQQQNVGLWRDCTMG